MKQTVFTTRDHDYGYPVTEANYHGSIDIDNELITDLPDVEIAFIVDFVSRLGFSHTRNSTSYGLKHVVQRSVGLYMSNNQFKSLMVLLGKQPLLEKDYQKLNWDCYFSKKIIQKAEDNQKLFEIIYGIYQRYFYKYRDSMKELTECERKERWQKFKTNDHWLVVKSKLYIKKLNENIVKYGVEKAIDLMPNLQDIENGWDSITECEDTVFNMLFPAIFGKDTLCWRHIYK